MASKYVQSADSKHNDQGHPAASNSARHGTAWVDLGWRSRSTLQLRADLESVVFG